MDISTRIHELRQRVWDVRVAVKEFAATLTHQRTQEFILLDVRWLDDIDGVLLNWAEQSEYEAGRMLILEAAERMLVAVIADIDRKRTLLEPLGPDALI